MRNITCERYGAYLIGVLLGADRNAAMQAWQTEASGG
jgi:hypothetical protein